MIPSLGTKLSDDPALFHEVWGWGTKVLDLQPSVRHQSIG
jgi:malate dehydrogenase (quinone)